MDIPIELRDGWILYHVAAVLGKAHGISHFLRLFRFWLSRADYI
jgi:hypothetical protein